MKITICRELESETETGNIKWNWFHNTATIKEFGGKKGWSDIKSEEEFINLKRKIILSFLDEEETEETNNRL